MIVTIVDKDSATLEQDLQDALSEAVKLVMKPHVDRLQKAIEEHGRYAQLESGELGKVEKVFHEGALINGRLVPFEEIIIFGPTLEEVSSA